ncbi:MAG: ABC transporter substrate-binding protein [Thermodesulfobacteriota bacterium]
MRLLLCRAAVFLALVFLSLPCGPVAAGPAVTDAAGRTVELPEKVEKILVTCYGGVTHQFVVLGAEDRIVGQPSMKQFPQLLKMRPGLAAIPDAGSFDNINIEEIVRLAPDVVFAGIISKKGNAKIEEIGLPLVTMYIGKARIEVMKEEFLRTGRILGREDKAKALVDYWDAKLGLVRGRVGTIPPEKRLRVYYADTDILHTEGGAWWTQDLLSFAGAVNVAENIGQARETTMEKLLEWDPEVIVVSRTMGQADKVAGILKDPQLRDLKAVRSGRVYEFPIGAFWWNRPSPEAPLGFLWLAKTLYPELMADIDMKKETEDFFKTFYGYELSDAEYESFITGPTP